jgi:hypothetical protein
LQRRGSPTGRTGYKPMFRAGGHALQLHCRIRFRQGSFFQCLDGLETLPTKCRTRSKWNPRSIVR